MLEALMDLGHVCPAHLSVLIARYNTNGTLTEQDFKNYNGYSTTNTYYPQGVKRAELRINLAFNGIYEVPSHSGGGEIEFLTDTPFTTYLATESADGIYTVRR